MSDRPVRLDVGAQGNQRASAHTSQSQDGGTRERPTDEQVDRFRSALGDAGRDESQAAPQPSLESPFALFRLASAAMTAVDCDSGRAPGDAARFALLMDEIADRILVSEDDPHEARVVIDDDTLRGVEVRIVREQGRWTITFTISDAASLRLLEESGERIAQELAERLHSDVEVQLIDATQTLREPSRVFRAGPRNVEAGESR